MFNEHNYIYKIRRQRERDYTSLAVEVTPYYLKMSYAYSERLNSL